MSVRKKLFEEAVRNEILSQKLYLMLAESFKPKPEISEILMRLCSMEQGHEEKLRAMFSRQFPGEEIDAGADITPKLTLSDINNPVEVLEFAITRETIAADIYHKMALLSTDEDLSNLVEELAADEENHRVILEEEILRLDGLITWYDPSELNGLVED